MSKTWIIQGIVKERPKEDIKIQGEFQGYDVYSIHAKDRGQINEMLINLDSKEPIILIGMIPGPDDTIEEIAEEFKNSALFALLEKEKNGVKK